MAAPTHPDLAEETAAPPPGARGRVWPRLVRGVLVAFAVVILVLIALGVGVRYGARTQAGRALIVRSLDGLPLGPVGRLRIAGLRGDVFDAFAVTSLSIVDARGPWLEARDLTLAWDPIELLARRVHAEHLHAGLLRIDRQPVMAKQAPQPASKMPVSIILDDLTLRLETLPALSVEHGVWDVAARGDVRRNGSVRATLKAKSLLHPGDGLTFALKVGHGQRFLLRADAVEAGGGALAGALGLPSKQTLLLHAVGDGTSDQGQASLKATSGAQTPLLGSAAWGKGGTTVQGRVSLTASRLTAYFAERLGPEAAIDLTARQTAGDLYAVAGTLKARDGSIAVKGPLNWARRATTGMDVSLAVSDLSKWISLPKIGAARVRGVLTGGVDAFTVKSTFEGDKLDQYGYALARLAGPASVSRKGGEWRLQTDLAGAGGGGKGLPAVLLGSAPHVQLDLSLLKDGRMLIHSLGVAGTGVKLAASGGQGLLGGLSFKGTVDLPNLGLLRPGARGGLSGAWDASENRGARAWDFTFDGKGSNVVSGVPDLDHLLGPAPRLTAKGGYGAGGLTIADAKLAGAAMDAQGKGGLDAKQALSADFGWSAKGPIVVGPVEIAGAAKGTGKITGALSAPRADLEAELASLDFGQLVVTPARLTLSFLQGPDGVTGAASVTGPTVKYGPASAKTAFHWARDGLVLTDIVADAGGVKLAGALSLRDGEPSTADLTVAALPGAFLASGKLDGKVRLTDGAGVAADIAIVGAGVSLPGAPTTFRSLSLQAQGPLKALPFKVSADSIEPVAWKFSGSGVFAHTPALNQVTLEGAGRVRKADFRLTEPAVVRFGGGDQSARLRLAIAGGQAAIDAHEGKGDLTARADLANVGMAAFFEDFTGTVSGSIALNGQGPHMKGTLDARLAGARSRDAPANEGLNAQVTGTLADTRLHIEANAVNAEGLKSNGALDLPTEASAAPFRIAVDRTKPVQGSFSADGEVRPLWDLFAGGERTLSGHVSTSGAVKGTLNTLAASGQGSLTGGKFRDVSTGLAVQNLEVDTTFGDNAITVRRFSGADARSGTVSGDGVVSIAEDGASTFTLNLKKFQLLDNDLGRATASGAVTVTHPAKGQGKLTGQLTIDRADIVAATPTPTGVVPMDVVEIHQVLREGQAKPQARASLGPPILLDVAIKAGRGIYVKGKGLNVELSLDSHVGGAITQPSLTGEARVVGGSYDFAGKRFDVDPSGVVRLAATPAQIRLNLSATWEDPTLTAVVKVQGTAAKPEITLTSVPVLPQDEVLSRVLFGVSATQLSAAQGAELASALASLSGGGGFDVIGNLAQFAGLDRLALGGTQQSGTTISGGKYVTKDIYLELTGGGRNGAAAQVEWRIRHNISLVSRYGAAQDTKYYGDEDASISIRFRKDF